VRMLDLRQEERRYCFRIAQDEDFWDTVRLLKNTFKPSQRSYNDATREWSVPASPVSEAKLAMIFGNAESSFTILKPQSPLFPPGG